MGKIKRKSRDKGWLILQCDRKNPLLQYSHVGIKGSLNDSIVNYCVLLSEEKANEIRVLKGKVNNKLDKLKALRNKK